MHESNILQKDVGITSSLGVHDALIWSNFVSKRALTSARKRGFPLGYTLRNRHMVKLAKRTE